LVSVFKQTDNKDDITAIDLVAIIENSLFLSKRISVC
jgi:hypothetical protein